MAKKNKFHSYSNGKLPKGCRKCVKGKKLVIFLTGLCPRNCYFCPVSDQKFQKDVIFANEKEVNNFEDIIEEALAMNAKGAGITGGDPLVKVGRVSEYIKKLKSNFGKKFHIHLYSSLNLVSKENLEKLYSAGLDEIRFHLDFDSKEYWERLKIVNEFSWDVGVELPLIPGKEKETKEIIDYIHNKIKFLNLNELEVADNEHSDLIDRGFEVKNQLSYAVKGSLESGLELMEYVKGKNYKIKIHVCTAKLKDAAQLSNRIKREGEIIKRGFDIIDSEGLLTRGALYLPELAPGFSYRKKLKNADKTEFISKLKEFEKKIKKELNLNEIVIDENKLRILLSGNNAIKNKVKLLEMGLLAAIVKEYPTADQFEVEVEFLK